MDYRVLKKERRESIERDVSARLAADMEDLSAESQQLCREIISDIAYACTFTRVRAFGNVYMDSERWRELAAELIVSDVLEIATALRNCTPSGNRLFYILGVAAKLYGRKHSKPDRCYKERNYTEKELKSVIRSIEELKTMEL